VPIEGIYDYLNTERPIRSGRFNKTLLATDWHKIIELNRGAGAGGPLFAYYRILNSAEGILKVRSGNAGTPVELQPGQSFDFEIEPGVRDIYVSPKVSGKIEGIYDFLGQQ
jgi:hypothetical protein